MVWLFSEFILPNVSRTKPYKPIGFGAMDVAKPYKFIGFGAMGQNLRSARPFPGTDIADFRGLSNRPTPLRNPSKRVGRFAPHHLGWVL